MAGRFNPILTITKREFNGYFASPVAFVFIVIFLLLSGFFTFSVAGFFERGQANLEAFFAEAPQLNPSRSLIKGVICGVRVEEIKEPTMQEIRYLDKLIDELARGKAMEKILRK